MYPAETFKPAYTALPAFTAIFVELQADWKHPVILFAQLTK